MLNHIFYRLPLIIFLLIGNNLNAQSINTEASLVTFSVSNFGLNTVNGSLDSLSGQVNFNPDALDSSYFEVSIKAATIDTGIGKRDEHLLKEDFFHVEKYPLIKFSSQKIQSANGQYKASGQLEMKGKTQMVTLPFSYGLENGKTVLSGEMNIQRLAFDIGSGYGGFSIGKEVTINIRCVLDTKVQ